MALPIVDLPTQLAVQWRFRQPFPRPTGGPVPQNHRPIWRTASPDRTDSAPRSAAPRSATTNQSLALGRLVALSGLFWGIWGAEVAQADAVVPDRCSPFFRPLIQSLLPVLPSYANRAIIRARSTDPPLPPAAPSTSQPHHVIAIGKVDFRPLSVEALDRQFPQLRLGAVASQPHSQQVFFTSIERRLTPQGVEVQQLAHWLFFEPQPAAPQAQSLASPASPPAETPIATQQDPPPAGPGGQFVKLGTPPGGYPDPTLPAPSPWDNTTGALAEGLRAQLRDCATP
ncbi:MAG: hypothetical protein ACO4AI_01110 [Prochlorothrix sp.]